MTESRLPLLTTPGPKDSLAVILKLVGETCNLDCHYCYEKRKPYEGSRILDVNLVRQFLRSLMPRKIGVEFHGGEPLLYPRKHFQQLAKVISEFPDHISRITMQTNGVYLDVEMLGFLRSSFPGIQIGISCDGPTELSPYRLDHSATDASAATIKALECVSLAGVNTGVICVVHNVNVGKPDALLSFFATFTAIKVVKFVPCFDFNVTQSPLTKRRADLYQIASSAEHSQPWAISPLQFTAFLEDLSRMWRDRRLFDLFAVEPLGSAYLSSRGLLANDCHFSVRKCAHVLTLYPDGSVGSCDELPRVASAFGVHSNISIGSPSDQPWNMESDPNLAPLLLKCEGCSYYKGCGGGCIATRLRLAQVGREQDYCDHRVQMLENISREMSA